MITFLNMSPSKNGISSDLIPADVILGPSNLHYNKLKITFGAYSKVYIGTNKSTKQIIVGAISLRPSNEQGG